MKFNSAAVLTLALIFSTIAQAQDDYAQPPMPPQSGDTNPAQQPPQPQFSQQELDQMLAPIALYPDALLSQVLMASTYPLEVVQAARWSRANPDLKGDQAVKAAQQNNWDPSVISLTAFPQILGMLDEKLEWTERLGDAFLEQQPQVMDTVQGLRQKAMAAGNLQSNDQVQVNQQAQQGQTVIVIQQAAPQVVYVPYYNPTVVYGPWWWDAYPPVYWNPWPGYYRRPGYNSGFYVGVGISVGGGFFFGNFDWHQRHVNVVNVNNYYYRNYYNNHPRPPVGGNPRPYPDRGAWQHDPDHRRGVPYPNSALQQQFSRPGNDARPPRNNRDDFQQNRVGNRQNPGGNPGNNSPDNRNRPNPAGQPTNAMPDRSPDHRKNANSPDARPQGPNFGRQNDDNRSPNNSPQRVNPEGVPSRGSDRDTGQQLRQQTERPAIQNPAPQPIQQPRTEPARTQASPTEAAPRIQPRPEMQRSEPQRQQQHVERQHAEQPHNEAPRPQQQQQRHEGGGHPQGGDKQH
ncbi:MAG: DUF3300 domain-containing protein [Methylophilaceae bacterium]|nr:DUF3300 domain-containing protein [Methyloradius sp.]